MDKNNLEDTKKSNNEWDENDILSEDMFNISNMSNMISMSSIPNMYMASMPNKTSLNSDVLLDENRESTKK